MAEKSCMVGRQDQMAHEEAQMNQVIQSLKWRQMEIFTP